MSASFKGRERLSMRFRGPGGPLGSLVQGTGYRAFSAVCLFSLNRLV